jgi:metal-responsive CopG/Arc/MetJ family transcriptional regulator
MKTIQITFDERLLEKLDNDDEVKQQGRSAVIGRAVTEYLRKRRRSTIAEAYRRGYGKRPAESDLNGWANEGVGIGD